MAGRTNTERIESLQGQVIALASDVQHLTADSRRKADYLEALLTRLTQKHEATDRRTDILEQRLLHIDAHGPAQIPLLAHRLAQIEKQLEDNRIRKWQLWLACIGAFLSIVVALIVSLVKR